MTILFEIPGWFCWRFWHTGEFDLFRGFKTWWKIGDLIIGIGDGISNDEDRSSHHKVTGVHIDPRIDFIDDMIDDKSEGISEIWVGLFELL